MHDRKVNVELYFKVYSTKITLLQDILGAHSQ